MKEDIPEFEIFKKYKPKNLKQTFMDQEDSTETEDCPDVFCPE